MVHKVVLFYDYLTKKVRMEIWLKTILLISMVYLPIVAGSSNHEALKNEAKLEVPTVEILASKPQGLPIIRGHIKKRINKLSGFAYRFHPILLRKKFHTGIDFPADLGTPIMVTAYGKVIKVQKLRGGYGNVVTIQSGDYTTIYAHCFEIFVEEGDYVSKGDIIASVGSSGLSTGPHLHYEVRYKGKPLNPRDYI
jgi:murein DD-endopeptidase MepM/ murein hydrolase activator NlpD